MANYKKLTPTQAYQAKCFIHDVLVAAGEIKPCKVEGSYSAPNGNNFKAPACQAVVDELKTRSFKNIDPEIIALCNTHFSVWKKASGRRSAGWRWAYINDYATAAAFIVHYALQIGLYWDDTIKSTYEIEVFEKTLLGKCVKEMGAYVSNMEPPKTSKTKKSTAAGGTNTGSGKQPPKDDYKSSGPQSGNVRDLKSQGKVTASATGNWIFKIEGTNAKSAKVTPTVHIKPLKAAGAAGNTNKVFFGSANGYTDCTCYFDDVKDADAFLQKVITNLPANISNPHVVKTKADSNGYFIVGTEYGDCAIAARKLNEALTEETKITEATDGYKPYDKEAYLTDCLKYYN